MDCIIVNLDRGEYLDPNVFGDGKDVRQFTGISSVILSAVGLLIADLESKQKDHPLAGRWAGHRVVVTPADGPPGWGLPAKWRKPWEEKIGKEDTDPCLFDFAVACYVDISPAAVHMLAAIPHVMASAGRSRRDGVLQHPPRIDNELRIYLTGAPVSTADPDDDSVFDVDAK